MAFGTNPVMFRSNPVMFSTHSVLFHGLSGTGKTHAALSVAYHADAYFFDLSPKNLAQYADKVEVKKIIATAFRAARFHQPAVIYFDNAEQIFYNAKARGSIKNPLATRLKRSFLAFVKLIKANDRIMFIGCTNKGSHMKVTEFKSMFPKSIYFGLPSYSDRFKIWKTFIRKKIGKEYDLDYGILAQMSNSFSSESVNNT